MISHPDYTSLADLWTEFEARASGFAYAKALELYSILAEASDLTRTHDEVGSPKDVLEEMFINSLRPFTISLLGSDREVCTIASQVRDGTSDVFARLYVLETTAFCEEEAISPEAEDWLVQMGSAEFKPWPHSLAGASPWQAAYPPIHDHSDAAAFWRDIKFHRLPLWFERNRFVIPKTTPPWVEDTFDIAFLKTTLPSIGGLSIALDKRSVSQ